MISFIEFLYACVLVHGSDLNNQIREDLILMNGKLVEIFNEISEDYATLQNNETFIISSGEKFNTMWIEFYGKLRTTLVRMNFREKLVKAIEVYSPINCKNSIMQHLNDLIAQFEQYLLNRLFRSMDNYASEEIKEIENALNSDSFFNLTDEKIKPELIENLKLGKKYSPKTNYSIKSEI